MRAVIQRVTSARVTIDHKNVGEVGLGYVILLGVGQGDTETQAEKLWDKIRKLRIFEDSEGKTNVPLADVDGKVMVISQFTLFADCKKGNRPSFTHAMEPEEAKRLYEYFLELVRTDLGTVASGEFGAMMDIELVNSGPFTILLDTDTL